MNKIQYINYLKIKGFDELPKEETIGSMIKKIGEPTTNEMVTVNELTFKYFMSENDELKKEIIKLNKTVSAMEDDIEWLNCLEQAGVDNWEGFGVAQDIRDNK